jgi:hypothetical protein
MVDALSLITAVHQYLDRQEDSLYRNVFDRFKDMPSGTLSTDGLRRAMQSLGMPVLRNGAEDLMAAMDLDENGVLDYEEFKRAVAQPLTQLEQWASMLPLAGLLASSLPISSGQGDQPLRDLSRLSEDQIDAAVDAFRSGLTRLLMDAIPKLRQMFKIADKNASDAARDLANGVSSVSKSKTFKMSTGDVTDFHKGLSSRIGKFCLTWVSIMSTIHYCLHKYTRYSVVPAPTDPMRHVLFQERRIPISPRASMRSTASCGGSTLSSRPATTG